MPQSVIEPYWKKQLDEHFSLKDKAIRGMFFQAAKYYSEEISETANIIAYLIEKEVHNNKQGYPVAHKLLYFISDCLIQSGKMNQVLEIVAIEKSKEVEGFKSKLDEELHKYSSDFTRLREAIDGIYEAFEKQKELAEKVMPKLQPAPVEGTMIEFFATPEYQTIAAATKEFEALPEVVTILAEQYACQRSIDSIILGIPLDLFEYYIKPQLVSEVRENFIEMMNNEFGISSVVCNILNPENEKKTMAMLIRAINAGALEKREHRPVDYFVINIAAYVLQNIVQKPEYLDERLLEICLIGDVITKHHKIAAVKLLATKKPDNFDELIEQIASLNKKFAGWQSLFSMLAHSESGISRMLESTNSSETQSRADKELAQMQLHALQIGRLVRGNISTATDELQMSLIQAPNIKADKKRIPN